MLKLIARLNKAGIFHSVTAAGVEILKQPANMDAAGKKMLKDYFGLEDFTVPKAIKDPFVNKLSPQVEQGVKKADQDVNQKKVMVNKGL